MSRGGSASSTAQRCATGRAARSTACTSAVDPETPVDRLGLGRQQVVEIAKALARDARLLVLDEPTAALTTGEVEALFELLGRLRARGIGIVYVSHRLAEVFRIADRITVLRDGSTVGTGDAVDLDEPRVVSMMVGRTVDALFPPARPAPGAIVLDVQHLTVDDPHRTITRRDIAPWQPASAARRRCELHGAVGRSAGDRRPHRRGAHRAAARALRRAAGPARRHNRRRGTRCGNRQPRGRARARPRVAGRGPRARSGCTRIEPSPTT